MKLLLHWGPATLLPLLLPTASCSFRLHIRSTLPHKQRLIKHIHRVLVGVGNMVRDTPPPAPASASAPERPGRQVALRVLLVRWQPAVRLHLIFSKGDTPALLFLLLLVLGLLCWLLRRPAAQATSKTVTRLSPTDMLQCLGEGRNTHE